MEPSSVGNGRSSAQGGPERVPSVTTLPPHARAFRPSYQISSLEQVRMLTSAPYVTNNHDRGEFPNELE